VYSTVHAVLKQASGQAQAELAQISCRIAFRSAEDAQDKNFARIPYGRPTEKHFL